jgi:hypothetical protein
MKKLIKLILEHGTLFGLNFTILRNTTDFFLHLFILYQL